MNRYFSCFLLALVGPTLVVSRPDGAPTCIGDASAPGQPHRSNGFDERSIEAGELQVSIGGELVFPDTPIQVETGVSYMVVISTTTFFRGVMTRLGGGENDVDTSTVFTLVEGEVDLKQNEFCDVDVGGLTHTSSVDKVAVSFLMEFSEASNDMAWDVNIVETVSPSVFYYSQYTINAVAPDQGQQGDELDLFDSLDQVDGGSTLVSLVTAAGLESTLKDPGQSSYTVLAPVQAAFDALPSDVVAYLTQNADILSFILQGHVLAGTFTSSAVALMNGQEVSFLNGVSSLISVTDSGIFIGKAQVLDVDVFASNGVIHSIDRILGVPTMMEFLEGEGLSALAVAISSAGISTDLLIDSTLFAPTTTALLGLAVDFPELGAVIITSQDWILHLQTLLLTHLYPETVFSSDLVSGQTLTMFGGADIEVNVGDTVTLAPAGGSLGIASIVQADVVTTQGAIHVLDQVLLPPFVTQSIADVVQANFLSLFSLFVVGGLDETLDSKFGMTVFAPNEGAFETLGSDEIEFLTSDEGLKTLTRILSYHVVPQVLPSSSLIDPVDVETMTGDGVFVSRSFGDLLVNDAVVVSADLLAYNGIIHTIDIFLEPPPLPDATNTAAPTTMDLNTTAPSVTPNITLAPTFVAANTTPPTMSPTLVPVNGTSTNAPTSPLGTNTTAPTVPPTLQPTNGTNTSAPTTSPSLVPTSGPVNGTNTSAPTAPPTLVPTSVPVNGTNTSVPAAPPTLAPTTASPTIFSNVTTDAPTAAFLNITTPTISPIPTAFPTIQPSVKSPTLSPTEEPSRTPSTTEFPTSDPASARLSVVEVIAQTFALQQLDAYITVSGIVDEFTGPGPFTFMAPWDGAFLKLDPTWAQRLQNETWNAHLQNLLHYHVTDRDLPITELPLSATLTMKNGEDVTITRRPDTVRVHVNGILAVAPYDATNGFAYMLDEVLLPSWFRHSLLDVVNAAPSLSTFASLVVIAELEQILSDSEGFLTVLAPDNGAFGNLGEGVIDFLLSETGLPVLQETLLYHIIALKEGPYPSRLFDSSPLETLANSETVSIGPGDPSTVQGRMNAALVVAPDQVAVNGVLHIIDTVLLLDSLSEPRARMV